MTCHELLYADLAGFKEIVIPHFRAGKLYALCPSRPQQELETQEQGLHLLVCASKCQAEVHKFSTHEGREGRRLIRAAMISGSQCYDIQILLLSHDSFPFCSEPLCIMNCVLSCMLPHLHMLT